MLSLSWSHVYFYHIMMERWLFSVSHFKTRKLQFEYIPTFRSLYIKVLFITMYNNNTIHVYYIMVLKRRDFLIIFHG